MSGDPVRAALEAAAKQFCICEGECYETRHGMMHGPCEQMVGQAAATIAAFLRALPVGSGKGLFEFGDDDSVQCLSLAEAAASVEAAAKGEK